MNHCDYHTLSRYVDGELSLPDRHQADRHLKQCGICAGELGTLRTLDRRVVAYGKRRVPLPITTEMRIRQDVDRRRRANGRRLLGRLTPAAVGSSIAAVLVLASFNLSFVYQRSAHINGRTATSQAQQDQFGEVSLMNALRLGQLAHRPNTHMTPPPKFAEMTSVD